MCRSSCSLIIHVNLHTLILFGSVYYYYYFLKTHLLSFEKDSATLRVEIERSKDPENEAISIISARDSKFLFFSFFNFFFLIFLYNSTFEI